MKKQDGQAGRVAFATGRQERNRAQICALHRAEAVSVAPTRRRLNRLPSDGRSATVSHAIVDNGNPSRQLRGQTGNIHDRNSDEMA